MDRLFKKFRRRAGQVWPPLVRTKPAEPKTPPMNSIQQAAYSAAVLSDSSSD